MDAQALRLAKEELRNAINGLVGAAERALAERRAEPHLWALFHRRMVAALPRIRWLARAYHRGRGRHYGALAWATSIVDGCTGEALAQKLKLPK